MLYTVLLHNKSKEYEGMYSRVITGAISGIDSILAAVEVDAQKGMPGFEMVGQLNNEVREAKERVRVALKNTSVEIPPMRITVSISPAEMRKEGASYDLPIAVGILVSLGLIPKEGIQDTLILGELGLNGEVHSVRGCCQSYRRRNRNKSGAASCRCQMCGRAQSSMRLR